MDSQNFKMASVISVKEKKLMNFKIGELPHWIVMQGFPTKGITGASQSCCYWYYKYVSVKKGSISGASKVAYML